MNTEPEQITPMKQTPLQSQPSAKTSAHRKKSIGLNGRLSGQGRKSQRSMTDDVSSPNQQQRSDNLSKRKSSIKQEKSPNMQTPMATSKSRQPKMIENSSGQDKPTYNRLSAPHTPQDTKNHKVFKSSAKKSQNDENQKIEKSKSATRKRVNQTEGDGTKKTKKVFAVSNEVINIMVPHYATKNKFNDNAVIQAEEGGKIEIWGHTHAKDISFVDSDVADEFEYKYDPDYLSPSRNNQSPKVRMNLNTHQKKGRSTSTTPNIIKKKKQLLNDLTPEKFLQSAAEEGFSQSNDFIKRTCKEISSARPKKKQSGKRNFVKRMVFDITKRNTREKTFDSLKNVLHLKVGQIDTSRSMSPNREFDGEEHSQRQSQSSNLISPKKFTPKDRDKFINRMWQYQERKEKAIEMLQDAKRQEEVAEYLQAIKNSKFALNRIAGKMTEKEKQQAHDRLIGDATKRKLNQEQVKQQMQFQQEEQEKILFRPKINNYIKEKQLKKSMKEKSLNKLGDTEGSNTNEIQTQTLTLEQKISLFQQEAHCNSRSANGSRGSKKNSALAMNTETQLNNEANDASFDAYEEGQVHNIKSLKS